jgi:hypothetical protein
MQNLLYENCFWSQLKDFDSICEWKILLHTL